MITTRNKSWGVNTKHSNCPLLSSLAAQPHVERRDARTGTGWPGTPPIAGVSYGQGPSKRLFQKQKLVGTCMHACMELHAVVDPR